ncbi:MAG: phosphoribosyltransferase family protein [Clostridia bacterium]|nr:phosphoribosyltransferase family protein [Clostridia bacterium]
MLQKLFRIVLDLLFPIARHCIFCWRKTEGTRGSLCADCAAQILQYGDENEACPRCGRFIAAGCCPNCFDWPPEMLARVVSVVPYDGIYKDKIFDLKYNGQEGLASRLGYLMARKAKALLPLDKDMLTVPVPLHGLREDERGYNQSALLAKAVAGELSLVYEDKALERIRYDCSQTALGRCERRANMDGVFTVKNTALLAGKKVLLVDDIITTGATMLAAAAALKAAGVQEIYGLTWAAGFDKVKKN